MTRPAAARARSLPVRGGVGLLTAVGAIVLVDPQHRHIPLCPLHAMTGWDCPLCGGLRAVDALVHGRFAAAAHANLLLLLAIPVVVGWWLRGRGRPAPRWAVVSTVALLAIFAVVRNLPMASVLRPS